MASDLKQGLVNRLKQVGAYDVRIANPNVGFEHVLEGQHPLELWQHCRSVIVFAVACSPETNNTYIGPYAPWPGERDIGPVPQNLRSSEHAAHRLVWLFIASIKLRGMEYLKTKGHSFSFRQSRLKLSAFEAGIGVYGRSGLIIHPLLGNRMSLGAIMTDAVLEPDGRLEGFEPCENCDLCIKECPAEAFDPTKRYPHSWSRKKCTSKRADIAQKGLYCHNCFAVCPAGKGKDEELLSIREAKSILQRDSE